MGKIILDLGNSSLTMCKKTDPGQELTLEIGDSLKSFWGSFFLSLNWGSVNRFDNC